MLQWYLQVRAIQFVLKKLKSVGQKTEELSTNQKNNFYEKIIPLLFVITSLTVAEEVSVYGASNQDSSYGLSATEKHILKNQSNISNLSSKLEEINSLVKSINGRLEGLESTYEGDSKN